MRCSWNLFLLMLAAPVIGVAQLPPKSLAIDSMIAEASNVSEDSVGVRLLDAIAYQYLSIAPEKSLLWAQRQLTLARKIGWAEGVAFAHSNIGLYHRDRSNYETAISHFDTAQSLLNKVGNEVRAAEVLLNLGSVHLYQKQYELALKHTKASLAVAKREGDLKWIESALYNIGYAHAGKKDFEEAIVYAEMALAIARDQRKDSQAVMQYTANIGAFHAEMKQFAKAIEYQYIALQTAERLGNREGVALYTGNIGANMVYIAYFGTPYKPNSLLPATKTALFAKGIDYLEIAIKICRELNYQRGTVHFENVLRDARVARQSPAMQSKPK